MGILIQESHLNVTKGYNYGDSEVYESCAETPGELFKSLRKSFGRCTSKVYIDRGDKSVHIGWVFQKLEKYTDCNDKYLAETWVTLHEKKPTHTVAVHYRSLK